MSLIDDALKRAQAAHQEERRKDAPAPPWTPAPLPDRRRGLRARPYVLAGAFLAVLGVGAFLALNRPPRTRDARIPAGPAPAASPRAPESAASTLPDITSEVIVEPPPRAAAPAPSGAAPGLAPKVSPRAAAAATPAAAAPLAERPARAARDAKTFVGEVPLPGGGKIELGGIVFSEENPTALINGRVLAAGAFVEGFEVTQIKPDRVELTGNGNTITVILK